jgi:DNA-binding MarR family transcriptional regulator
MTNRQHAVKTKAARTEEGDAFSVLAFQILRLSAILTTAGDELARPAGQTSARWQVLAAIQYYPVSVAEIARALSLARQSVQRIADVLEREGFAEYTDNPDHARAKLLGLTAKGKSSLATIQDAQRAWADAIGAQIGTVSLKRASKVLQRVEGALSVLADGELEDPGPG